MFEEKKSINETRLQRVNYKGQEKKTVMKKSITKQTERGEKVQNNECTKVVYRVVYNTKKTIYLPYM